MADVANNVLRYKPIAVDKRRPHLRGTCAVEGVGFQNVSASLQKRIVNVSNHIRASDDKQVIVALELIRMALIAISPKVLFSQPDQNTLRIRSASTRN